ncbi:MAG: hypothetical protein HDR80_07610 [Bacteroides sp.]|nr:hypothetical protein [Bacteroides sp.]
MTSNIPLLPFDPPVEITYDPDTRVIEVTGDNDWLDHIFLCDEFGNWFHDDNWLPYTFTIPADHSGIWVIRIYGADSDDWDIYAKIAV